jgi:hypothetical protein
VRVTEITDTLFGRNAEHLNVTAAHKCVPRGVMTLILGHVSTVTMKVIQTGNIKYLLNQMLMKVTIEATGPL